MCSLPGVVSDAVKVLFRCILVLEMNMIVVT